MNSKLLGGILLIVGTALGGGMLALPISTSQTGFLNSSLLLLTCWIVMTLCALLILEVNLWLPINSNMISMAKVTLGNFGRVIAWIVYLLLLYSLLAAYMAGGGDFLHNLLESVGLALPSSLATLLFAITFATIVYLGIRSVDYFNRGLMLTKLAAYLLLAVFLSPFISLDKLAGGEFKYITASVTVTMTSFGFATIVPSLRSYFNDDVPKIRRAILIGSLIPLVCYVIWDLIVMGVVPRSGDHGLIAMMHSDNSTSEFVNSIISNLNVSSIAVMTRVFAAVCLATAFLGVSLSLSDFLADGLGVEKKGTGNIIIYSATFFPPLLIVLFYPGIFITALSYAGILCVILLVLLPVLMAWQGRYSKQLNNGGYQVMGGKLMLAMLMISGLLLIGQGIKDACH